MLTGASGSSGTSGAAISGSRAAQDAAKMNDELNRFMNLLITQLKNQDPLNPMDANEFTNQLVQFASVEQQIHQNANLEKLVSLQNNSQVAAMVGYLGTAVEASGSSVPLEDGKAKFTYSLPEQAKTNSITISDSSGKVVRSFEGELTTGRHTLEWDGANAFGTQLADGAYTVTVSAVTPAGAPIEVTQTVFGKVTAASSEDGTPTLYMGDIAIPMDNILRVERPIATPAQPDTETQ